MSAESTPPYTSPTGDSAYREAVLDLLGTVAYGELVAHEELTADGALAPDLGSKIAMARLAGEELAHFEAIAARLGELDADPHAAMTPFRSAVDAYHARTQGRTWAERLVKAYVGEGIRTDFYREIAALVDPQTAELVLGVATATEARDDWLVAGIREAIAADPRIEGRLALWGRRLMGEAISQAQQVAVEREALASLLVGGLGERGGDIAELGRMVARMTERHADRMTRLGLAA